MGNREFIPSSGYRSQPGLERIDGRVDGIYSVERRSLGFSEALRLLIKSWPFIRPHSYQVALKFVLALTSLALFLITPWPMKIVIDNVLNRHPLTGVPRALLFPIVGDSRMLLLALVCGFLVITAILIGMVGDNPQSLNAGVASEGLDQVSAAANDANDGWSLFNGLFGLLEIWVTLDLTQRMNQSVRTTTYERLLRYPLRIYADQKIGDAVFRVMNDSASIGNVLYQGVLAPLMSILMFAMSMAVLAAEFRDEPLIPILAMLSLPIFAVISALFGRTFRDQNQRMRERGSDLMAVFEERLAQVHLIKAYGQELRETSAVDTASSMSFGASLRMLVLVMAALLCALPAVALLVGFGLYALMSQVIAGRLTLGDVVLLSGYGMMLGRPMAELGFTWAKLQEPIAGMRRIHSVLDSLPVEPSGELGAQLPAAIKEIEFRNVAIAYNHAAPVLCGINMHIFAGELTGLAGPSGSGKTSLIHCIPRFIEPYQGSILINRRDIASYRLCEIRRRIAVVFQQEVLFSASVVENIRYGAPTASDEAVRRAARMAGAAEFIEQLPGGYGTVLGRRGARLSVGQKQRVAVARALLRDPSVLILDEPMAPLDAASGASLMLTLQHLARTRIVIIIAHRANTLAACDRVYFVNGGTIAAGGAHQELRATCPAYENYLATAAAEIRG